MPDLQLPEILFTLIIGTFTMALLVLTLRESHLRSQGR